MVVPPQRFKFSFCLISNLFWQFRGYIGIYPIVNRLAITTKRPVS